MGYYTRFNIEVQDIDKKGYDAYKIVKYMLDKQNESDAFYPFRHQLEDFIKDTDSELGTSYRLYLDDNDEYKWYECDDEMIALSKEFPEVLFKVHGEGEESGDIWDRYFMNGKTQYCPAEVMCPPFDRTKLS